MSKPSETSSTGGRDGTTRRSRRRGRKRARDLTPLRVVLDGLAQEWRAAELDAESALRRWRGAGPEQRTLAAVAYVAAMDREERAATRYRMAWEAWCSAVN
jgi:hypothetical protein